MFCSSPPPDGDSGRPGTPFSPPSLASTSGSYSRSNGSIVFTPFGEGERAEMGRPCSPLFMSPFSVSESPMSVVSPLSVRGSELSEFTSRDREGLGSEESSSREFGEHERDCFGLSILEEISEPKFTGAASFDDSEFSFVTPGSNFEGGVNSGVNSGSRRLRPRPIRPPLVNTTKDEGAVGKPDTLIPAYNGLRNEDQDPRPRLLPAPVMTRRAVEVLKAPKQEMTLNPCSKPFTSPLR